MRKYIFGIVALVFAISLNSFDVQKNDSTQDPTYYWYSVNAGYGGQNDFINSEVTYLSGPLTIANAPTGGCGTVDPKKCVVGFNEDQINLSDHTLKSGDQTPPQTKSYRTTN